MRRRGRAGVRRGTWRWETPGGRRVPGGRRLARRGAYPVRVGGGASSLVSRTARGGSEIAIRAASSPR